MTRRTEKTFKRAVDKLVPKLRWYFFANQYRLDVHYVLNEYKPHESNPGAHVAATIEIDESYLRAKLTLYRGALDAYLNKPETLFDLLLHEYSHFITEPFYRLAKDSLCDEMHREFLVIRERQTELIALMLASKEGLTDLRKYAK